MDLTHLNSHVSWVFGVSQPHRSLDLWTGSQWQLGLSYLQEIQRDLQPSVVSISAAMSACEGGEVVLVNHPENMK